MQSSTHSSPHPALPPTRSWRSLFFACVIAAHLAGAALIAAGMLIAGAGIIIASHLALFWGGLQAGSPLYGPVHKRFIPCGRQVWLTIDDGPSGDTAAMLDLLEAYQARATFFLIAERARARPDLARAIVERGHTLGNHTRSHPAATFWMTLPATMHREIAGAQQILETITGTRPRLFRSVAGMSNAFVDPCLRRLGLRQIGWSVRGLETFVRRPTKIVARLLHGLEPGAILLMHEGMTGRDGVRTLELLLEELTRRGYVCVIPRAAGP